MNKEVSSLLEWDGTDGSRRCIIIVKDENKMENEIGHLQLELCKYDRSEDKWETQETIDSIDEIDSFGIPKEIID